MTRDENANARRGRATGRALAAAAVAVAGTASQATWSIIIVDTKTGEVAVASATCLSNFDLRAASPVVVPEYGAAAAQSFVESQGRNRVVLRDGLIQGTLPSDVFALLASLDPSHQTRQYGMGNTQGLTGTFTGTGAFQWAGGVTGKTGDLVWAVQGNILTGAPVVEAAAQAIMNGQGDIADRLMASMQAARSFGGDGRCSCSPAAPTSCGSPPPSFTTSASTGYMIIGRFGDTTGCNSAYRLVAAASGQYLEAGDFDGDGRTDVVVSDVTIAGLSVHRNITPPLSPTIVMSSPAQAAPAGNQPRDIAVVDANGDGKLDVAVVLNTENSLAVLLGNGDGTFQPATKILTQPSPTVMVSGSLFPGSTGGDLAYVSTVGFIGTLQRIASAPWYMLGPSLALVGVSTISAGEFEGDSDTDLLVTFTTGQPPQVYRNTGFGAFFGGPTIVTPAGAFTDGAVGDLNGDGKTDAAVINPTTGQVVVALAGTVSFATTTFAIPTPFPQDVQIGDVTGDGKPDVVLTGAGPADFRVLKGDGAGGFVLQSQSLELRNTRMELADLDGDGDLDVLGLSNTRGGLTIADNYGGVFRQGAGCATGDYYMNLNYVGPIAGPDAVEELQKLFDTWKAGQVGRPDAVRTSAAIDPPVLSGPGGSGGQGAVMTINVRDRSGTPVNKPGLQVTVEHAASSAGITDIGPVVPVGNGAFVVFVTTVYGEGVDVFDVTIDDGIRPVVLMPRPTLQVDLPVCYADCTLDGTLSIFDYICFSDAYAAQNAYADCDGSGSFTIFDYICFSDAYTVGCP